MDIAITADDDLDITGGKLSFVSGIDAIAQHIKIRSRFFLGEWFLDTREGVPYFRDVLVKNPSRAVIVSTFKRVLLDTPGVATIDKFELVIERETRAATIDWEVTTIDGATLSSADYGSLIIGRLV